jgi:hypothetical protein
LIDYLNVTMNMILFLPVVVAVAAAIVGFAKVVD